MSDSETFSSPEAIAVVGMACRVPGAESPDEFWRNLRAGAESITLFSAQQLEEAGIDPERLKDPSYVAAKGVLTEADGFDENFFGLSPREAALMDPQQRVFLETAWAALEDAGYESRSYPGSIGVFAGSILSIYLVQNLWPNRQLVSTAGNFQVALGNDPTFLATSTSYHLDLRGPSVSVGTACSTSLVAVHLACQSLLAFESDMALAGGVSVHLPLVGGYHYQDGGILSPDGHCRPFDAAAQGTVSSDGAGIVVLKRLSEAVEDGDVIHAVIRGSAVNNDGSQKVGFTAPSPAGEARAITEAMAMAEVEPETMAMVETHGAGTLLGDPIEFAALVEAFEDCDDQRGFCALSSVKSNVGHLDAASGIAGLIKTVLALRHREIPPTLHFTQANPQIDLENSPFYVNSQLRPMADNGSPLRAGVSSFGIGGTNAHVILEEAPAPEREPDRNFEDARPFDLLVLSARTESALDTSTDRLARHLEQADELDLADVCFTLRHGRRAFEHRRILVCEDREDAVNGLRAGDSQRLATAVAPGENPSVALMFPGLGDHYPGMGWELYCTEAEFRSTIDRCADLLQGHLKTDIRNVLYPDRDWTHPVLDRTAIASAGSAPSLNLRAMLGRTKKTAQRDATQDRPAIAQPAIFVTEIALAKLVLSWGVEPEAMIGHSIGEFAAAHLAGVLTLPDALELVAARARMIQQHVQPGAMLAVPLSEDELRPILPTGVSLGAVNRMALCIASGEVDAVERLEAILSEQGASYQRLNSTHAYHSAMMEAIVEPLAAVVQKFELRAPSIPYISCITGTWISDQQATDPQYWARHLCRTVRFQKGLGELLEDSHRVLFEVGPGQSLTSHAIGERSRISGCENPVIPAMRWSYDRQSEIAVLLNGIGHLWLAGAALDTSQFLAREQQPRRVRLPTYPFERRRHWIDPPAPGEEAIPNPSAKKEPDIADWFYLPYWKPSICQRARHDVADRRWLLFVDRNAVGADLAKQLRSRGESVVTVQAGDGFSIEGDAFVIDPSRVDDYAALVRELRQRQAMPTEIVHLWCLTSAEGQAPSTTRFAALQELGYASVMRLLQAVGRETSNSDLKLQIIANHLHSITGNEELIPEKAILRAPTMVAPQEYPGLICRCVDTDIPPEDRQRRPALLAQLMDEIHGGSIESTVAYRQGLRQVLKYEPVRLEGVTENRIPFRQRGVYLLTGGLGGIGLVLAQHLAQTVQARLVLVGRSSFPPQADWPTWLDEHDESDPICQKIRQLQTLEALGSEVLVLSADVSDPEAMRRVLAAGDKRFGPLHGVIHGAGAIGLEAFQEIGQATPADWQTQFVAKVHGTLVLDDLLTDRPLDFCLLMSSLSAVLGGLGFAAYSAANLFMDSFAHWRNRAGDTRWISVDWDSWRLTDVRPAIPSLGATISEFVMDPEEGVAACERILAEAHLNQVVVSSGDLQARLDQWIDSSRQQDHESGEVTRHQRPNLATDYVAPTGEIEVALTEIWQELFGVAEIGTHDNFFELGGHSLLATQLNARIHSTLQVEMPLATLLQIPTIADLAVAVVNQQAEQVDSETLEKLLAEVGDLSDQEVQRLIAGNDLTHAALGGDD